MSEYKIVWTKIDEAPALATYALLPVVKAYAEACGIEIETKDISLAGRIIANFPDELEEEQKKEDALAQLGELVNRPEANIIKLPNISASIPQLQAAIKELQSKGYKIPDYPQEPKNEEERLLQKRFAKVLGSAVNPVLREGNSDRRAAESVKKFAKMNPHKMMKPWPKTGSKARVAYMEDGDFYGSEKSVVVEKECKVKIEFTDADGNSKLLREFFPLLAGEVIDSAVMNVGKLRKFYEKQIEEAKKDDCILSLHMKATMMKISDPIIFGHCVSVYYEDLFEKYGETFEQIGVNVNNGFADVLDKLETLDENTKAQVLTDIQAVYENRCSLAMVDSRYGITNLNLPNNVIVDASMPNVVRDGGKMWNKNDELQDTIAMIPDRCYATMYQTIIEDCQKYGQFDPATMGSVSNVGLMAQKAEEYGSHDKTFEVEGAGTVNVVDDAGNVLMSQGVEKGDIFRMCQVKDAPIRNWVQLAVSRAKAAGAPAVFWLDENRAHDAQIIKKVNEYLGLHDTSEIEVEILTPVDAMRYSLDRIRKGLDTISVTGNVLRDYLTDLFPILELGTSARMLSIVPLMNGGGLFETGAGGSAPKHVQQFLNEGHLRWDSLGEYCALVPSLELIAEKTGNQKAYVLADALSRAISKYLENGRSPSRKVNEPDNRSGSYYLAMYWAEELAEQDKEKSLKDIFAGAADKLKANEAKINEDMLAAQGRAVDIGGYYMPVDEIAEKQMRPSAVFNEVIDGMKG